MERVVWTLIVACSLPDSSVEAPVEPTEVPSDPAPVTALALPPAETGPVYLAVAGTGVVRWSASGFETVLAYRDRIDQLVVAPDGAIWVVAGGLHRILGEKVTQERGLGVVDVAVGADGTVWASELEGLAVRRAGGAWDAVPRGSIGDLVFDLAVTPNGTPWVATDRGLWTRADGDWEPGTLPGPAAGPQVTFAALDDHVVLLSPSGLMHLQGGS